MTTIRPTNSMPSQPHVYYFHSTRACLCAPAIIRAAFFARRAVAPGLTAFRRRVGVVGVLLALLAGRAGAGSPMQAAPAPAGSPVQTTPVSPPAPTAAPPVAPAETAAARPFDAEAAANALEQMESVLMGIARQARPAVVSIEGSLPGLFGLPPHEYSPAYPANKSGGGDSRRKSEGADPSSNSPMREGERNWKEADRKTRWAFRIPVTGSGFLLPGGFVVTTSEVTEGVRDPVIVLASGQRLKAEWVSAHRQSNLAVLKVAGVDQSLGLRWGDSGRTQAGSLALTIGNQAGFAQSVSLGLVSGVGRVGRSGERRYANLIQFQGAVGAGGSGGPLLNARGEVIGIIVATPAWDGDMRLRAHGAEKTGDEVTITQTLDALGLREEETPLMHLGGVANTGFALPADDIKPLVAMLAQRMQPVFRSGWLGVDIPLESQPGPATGALIRGVYVGGPAEGAGIQPGDLVVIVNGQAVHSTSDVRTLLKRIGAGDTLRLTVRRGGALITAVLTVAPRPDIAQIRQTPLRETPH